MPYQTLAEAGYSYVCPGGCAGEHVLRNEQAGKLEVWGCSKNHASYGLKWRNTHLEFLHDLAERPRTWRAV